jgi:hypothetical protein
MDRSIDPPQSSPDLGGGGATETHPPSVSEDDLAASSSTEASVEVGAGEHRSPAGSSLSRGRRILVQVLIWGTSLLAVLAIFAVWANRQLLNPDNWANTSTKLLQDPGIRTATSNYLVGQLFAGNDVSATLKARLPAQLQPLAEPLSGALQSGAVAGAERALASPRVQALWKQANRAADQSLVAIVNGGKGALHVAGGEVTLDLASIVRDLTNRLGLPDLASKLPPSVAHLTILKSNQIKAVQDIGKALKGLALLLTILVPLLYAFAIFLAPGRRRRTLMSVGINMVAVGVLVLAARVIVENAVVDSLVKVDANKPVGHTVISIATTMLGDIAGAFVIVGIPLIAAAWFAGPARLAVRARRALAPFLREQPVATYAIVSTVMVLIFIWGPIPAMHKLVGIIIFFALALFGIEVLRRQTAAEFPDGAVVTPITAAGAAG